MKRSRFTRSKRCLSAHQLRTARLMNSGPLSTRISAGSPRALESCFSTLITRAPGKLVSVVHQL
jgi:hypothetical protein